MNTLGKAEQECKSQLLGEEKGMTESTPAVVCSRELAGTEASVPIQLGTCKGLHTMGATRGQATPARPVAH